MPQKGIRTFGTASPVEHLHHRHHGMAAIAVEPGGCGDAIGAERTEFDMVLIADVHRQVEPGGQHVEGVAGGAEDFPRLAGALQHLAIADDAVGRLQLWHHAGPPGDWDQATAT
jgi:hypothetical protein